MADTAIKPPAFLDEARIHYWESLSEGTQQTLIDYFERRYDPGHYISSFLENGNVHEAVLCAGENKTLAEFRALVWIVRDAPRNTWGSKERVQTFLNGGSLTSWADTRFA